MKKHTAAAVTISAFAYGNIALINSIIYSISNVTKNVNN